MKLKELPGSAVLGDLDVVNIMKCAEDGAWRGTARQVYIKSEDRQHLLEFCGHTYEPGYEDFSATCEVTAIDSKGQRTVLFDETDRNVAPYRNITITTGSMDAVQDFISLHSAERVVIEVL